MKEMRKRDAKEMRGAFPIITAIFLLGTCSVMAEPSLELSTLHGILKLIPVRTRMRCGWCLHIFTCIIRVGPILRALAELQMDDGRFTASFGGRFVSSVCSANLVFIPTCIDHSYSGGSSTHVLLGCLCPSNLILSS